MVPGPGCVRMHDRSISAARRARDHRAPRAPNDTRRTLPLATRNGVAPVLVRRDCTILSAPLASVRSVPPAGSPPALAMGAAHSAGTVVPAASREMAMNPRRQIDLGRRCGEGGDVVCVVQGNVTGKVPGDRLAGSSALRRTQLAAALLEGFAHGGAQFSALFGSVACGMGRSLGVHGNDSAT